MAIVQLLRVAIRVRDLERSTEFYRDVLGYREVAAGSFAGATSSLARAHGPATRELASKVLERDGRELELVALTREPSSPPAPGDGDEAFPADRAGLSHLTFVVDDLRSTIHSLRDRGVRVLEDTLVEHARGIATTVIADPDGLLLLLYERPPGVANDERPVEPAAAGRMERGQR